MPPTVPRFGRLTWCGKVDRGGPDQLANSEELAGASRVGMPTIAFNYDAGARADVFLTRFEELLELVGDGPGCGASGLAGGR